MRPCTLLPRFARVAVGLSLALVACTQESTTPGPWVGGTLFAVGRDAVTGASITTSADDYQPGDSVEVVGDGWAANETVHFTLTREPDAANLGPVEWDVEASEQGAFVTGFQVTQSDFGTTFTMTATGAASGSVATAMFTDGQTIAILSFDPASPIAANPFAINLQTVLTAGDDWTSTKVELTRNSPSYASNPIFSRCYDTTNRTTDGTWTASPTVPASGTGWDSGQTLVVGSYTVVVTGYGTTNDCTGTVFSGGAASLTVAADLAAATETALSVDINPTAPGQPVTYTAVVTRASDDTPIGAFGSVQFKKLGTSCSNGTLLGTVALDGAGSATYTLSAGEALAMADGSTIRACYQGDVSFLTSNTTITQYVLAVTKVATNQNPSNADADPDFYTLGTSEFVITVANPAAAPAVTPTIHIVDRIPSQLSNAGATAPTFEDVTGTWSCSTVAPVPSSSTASISCQTDTDIAAGASVAIKIKVVPTSVATNITNRISARVGSAPALPGAGAGCTVLIICENVDILLGPPPVISQPTTTAVAGLPNPSVNGESVSFTATVTVTTGGAPVTTGTVTFRFGGTDCTDGSVFALNAPLNGSGQATGNRSFSAAESGATIRACYAGATGYDPSSGTTTQTVGMANTTTTLSDAPTASSVGQNVVFTATVAAVAPGAGTPTGTVTLYEFTGVQSCLAPGGASVLGLPGTLSGGTVDINVSSLTSGNHTITACYGGDAGFNGSSGTDTHGVTLNATTTGITSLNNPSVTGQNTTFTATVKDAALVAVTTGSVTFQSGGTSCSDVAATTFSGPTAVNGSGQVTTGTVSYNATQSTQTIRACYAGTATYAESENSLTQTIDKANTTTTLGASPGPSTYGEQVTFTATVAAAAPGAGTPTGTVSFYEFTVGQSCGTLNGANAIDTGTLSSPATIDVSTLGTGSHTITACYEGDNDFEASEDVEGQQVNQASLEITASSGSKTYGQSYTVTPSYNAFVLGEDASVLTAQPSCSSGGDAANAAVSGSQYTTSCTGATAANYAISYKTGKLTVNPAPLTITASGGNKAFNTVFTGSCSYLGFVLLESQSTAGNSPDAWSSLGSPASAPVAGSPYTTTCSGGSYPNYDVDRNDGSLTIDAVTTTLTLATPDATQYSDKVRLDASVTPTSPSGGQTQSGSVEFFINSSSVGTAALSSDAATLIIANTRVPGGVYNVTARFTSTNTNFSNDDAGPVTLTVNKEGASITPDAANAGSIPVAQTSLTLVFGVKETTPEPNPSPDPDSRAAAGDINNAGFSVTLNGVASNQNYSGSCGTSAAGTGYATKTYTCTFTGPFAVDAYTIGTNVTGSYYVGTYEDAMSVYDPSLGFVTGGGKFIDSDNLRVSFGFSFTYTGKGKTGFRGGWVVVKHLTNGGVCRVKSNTMNAPAVNANTASLSGKSNYSCVDANGTTTASAGNLSAVGWVLDGGTAGIGVDKFWIAAGTSAPMLNMPGPPTTGTNAKLLTGGNIQVPQPK